MYRTSGILAAASGGCTSRSSAVRQAGAAELAGAKGPPVQRVTLQEAADSEAPLKCCSHRGAHRDRVNAKIAASSRRDEPPGTSAGIAGFPHGCRKPDSPKQIGEARVGSQAVERRMSPNAVSVNHAGDANQSPIISLAVP
jgi:hypothetical protein